MLKTLGPVFGEDFVIRGFKVLKFAIKSLSALGDEIFRLTPQTRGGLLLIMMIFFSAWVLGAAIFVETHGTAKNCVSIGNCTYSLMRLTFFDGDGLDLAYSLVGGYKILFFIAMLYMCITSFGIINGLIGIFGTLFQNASEKAFEHEEDDSKYGREAPPEQDDDDEDDDESEEDEENGGAVMPDNQTPFSAGGEQHPARGSDSPKRKVSEEQLKNASDLMKSVNGEEQPLNEIELTSALRGAMGKQPSRLALQEFQQEQEESRPNSARGKQGRKGSKEERKTIPYEEVEVYAVEGADLDRVAEGRTRNKPGGVFSKHKVHGSSGGMVSSGSTNELALKHLTGQMVHMQQKLDHQNELIISMFNQLNSLNSHIHAGNVPQSSTAPSQRPSDAHSPGKQVKFPASFPPATTSSAAEKEKEKEKEREKQQQEEKASANVSNNIETIIDNLK
jgi:hypothetical protein